jgi:hypothetical protein
MFISFPKHPGAGPYLKDPGGFRNTNKIESPGEESGLVCTVKIMKPKPCLKFGRIPVLLRNFVSGQLAFRAFKFCFPGTTIL